MSRNLLPDPFFGGADVSDEDWEEMHGRPATKVASTKPEAEDVSRTIQTPSDDIHSAVLAAVEKVTV